MNTLIPLALAALLAPGGERQVLAIAPVAPGLFRGPAPRTAADFDQLQALGVRTVIDLRKFNRHGIAREQEELLARGIAHKNCPLGYHPECDGSAERAYRALLDAAGSPIYVHCAQGRDRNSLVVGLYRVRAQGWAPEAAYAEMRDFGLRPWLRALSRYFWRHALEAPSEGPCSR
jgi:protein tyrosine/serine phosphatase